MQSFWYIIFENGSLVLIKDKCHTNKAKLYVTGRDIEYKELSLEFDKQQYVWRLDGCDDENDCKSTTVRQNPVLDAVIKLVDSQGDWNGTASELIENIRQYSTELTVMPNVLTKTLNQNREELLQHGICYEYKRTSLKKIITLTKVK